MHMWSSEDSLQVLSCKETIWVLGIELRSLGLVASTSSLLSHLAGPPPFYFILFFSTLTGLGLTNSTKLVAQ